MVILPLQRQSAVRGAMGARTGSAARREPHRSRPFKSGLVFDIIQRLSLDSSCVFEDNIV